MPLPERPLAMQAALAAHLARAMHADVRIDAIEPVTAGARRLNALIDVTVADVARPMVITQLPNESDAFRSIEDEVACIRLAEAAGVNVAHVVTHCPTTTDAGGPFFVSDRIDGVSIPRQVVDLCASADGLGATLAFDIGASLAPLHRIPIDQLPDAIDRPTSSAVEGALAWAEEQMTLLLQPSPAFALVMRWLERNAPSPVPVTLVHGDVRNGNILVNASGLAGILDWETAHIGEPFEDLGWLAQLMWRARNDSVEIGGFGNRSDLRAGYESAGGQWDHDRFEWWKVFRTLWWGLGLANQARQHLDGTFPSIIMAASGRRVAELEWDALCLIQTRT